MQAAPCAIHHSPEGQSKTLSENSQYLTQSVIFHYVHVCDMCMYVMCPCVCACVKLRIRHEQLSCMKKIMSNNYLYKDVYFLKYALCSIFITV